MHDSDLKKLLLETHPVRPGQEARAWNLLQQRLFAQAAPASSRTFWRWVIPSVFAVMALVVTVWQVGFAPAAFASATSMSPGIYATSFYSSSAKAQVVWLDGMEPASGRPTYLDPTSVMGGTPSPDNSPAGM